MNSDPRPDALLDPDEPAPDPEEGVRPPLLSMLLLVLFPFLVVLALMVLDGWVRRGGS